MKKINIIPLVGLTLILISTSFSTAFTTNNYKSLDLFDDLITLDFTFDKPVIETIIQKNTTVQSISITNLEQIQGENIPIVPVKPVKILLPYGKTVDEISVEITSSPETYQDINLKKGSRLFQISHQTHEITTSNPTHLQTQVLYENLGVQYYRGFPILFLNIYPITYTDDTKEITYYPTLKVEIHTSDDSPSRALRGLPKDTTYVTSIVENPAYIDTYPSDQQMKNGIDYIIITNEQLAQSGLEDNFQTLIYSKQSKGLSAEIFITEDIINNSDFSLNGTWGDNNPSNPFYQHQITQNHRQFDDKAARIRNFIRYAYYELGVEYVLLGGDGDVSNEEENIIPGRGLFANESGLPLDTTFISADEEEDDIPSDVYYACLDGSFNYDMDEHFGESPDRNDILYLDEADLLSEVAVGRASVDSEIEIAYFVSKTIQYEHSQHPYLSKILFLGEYLGFPGVSAYGGNYKDLVKPYIPGIYNLETLYDRDLSSHWSKYDLIEILNNAPPHMINHDGHAYYGYNLKMHNADVDLLTNTNTFFVYSHGCMAGGFDNPNGFDCIAERLTVETHYGAFAVIMNARYGLGSEDSLDSPSQALDESFFKALFEENIREIGKANHYSKEDNIWQINANGIRWVYYQTNLFGDPELSIKNPDYTPFDIFVDITTPEDGGAVYLKNIRLFPFPFVQHPIIIGSITIEAEARSEPSGNIYSVEFFIDNISKHIDTKEPYTWTIPGPMKGTYELSAVAHGYYGEAERVDNIIQIWIPS